MRRMCRPTKLRVRSPRGGGKFLAVWNLSGWVQQQSKRVPSLQSRASMPLLCAKFTIWYTRTTTRGRLRKTHWCPLSPSTVYSFASDHYSRLSLDLLFHMANFSTYRTYLDARLDKLPVYLFTRYFSVCNHVNSHAVNFLNIRCIVRTDQTPVRRVSTSITYDTVSSEDQSDLQRIQATNNTVRKFQTGHVTRFHPPSTRHH